MTRYTPELPVDLVSAARTTTGTSSAVDVGSAHTVRGLLDVTAISGTGATMDLTLQTSHDGATGWVAVAAFPQVLLAGGPIQHRRTFVGLNKFVRWSWVIAGTTPSVTFSTDADLVGA